MNSKSRIDVDHEVFEILEALSNTADRLSIEWFLCGAEARVILFEKLLDLPAGRRTNDLDFAVHVSKWEDYEYLKAALLADARFTQDERQEQRLLYRNYLVVDLIPYGSLSSDNKSIVWPKSGNVMVIVGFKEVYESSLLVIVNDSLKLRVPTPPSLLALKLLAWKDRWMSKPKSDSRDIATIFEAGTRWYMDDLFEQYLGIMEESGYDSDLASAMVLGIQMGETLHQPTGGIICSILQKEIDDDASPLISDLEHAFGSSRNSDFILQVLTQVLNGLKKGLADDS